MVQSAGIPRASSVLARWASASRGSAASWAGRTARKCRPSARQIALTASATTARASARYRDDDDVTIAQLIIARCHRSGAGSIRRGGMQRAQRRVPRRIRQRLPSSRSHFLSTVVHLYSRRICPIEDALVPQSMPHHEPKVSLHPRLSCCSLARTLFRVPGMKGIPRDGVTYSL